eukprot:COSAG02_NODE_39560_length_415_cov_1.664557_1_plen_73_part_10
MPRRYIRGAQDGCGERGEDHLEGRGPGVGGGGPTGAGFELRPLVQSSSERVVACPALGLRKQPGFSLVLSGL